jgi:hypothetical protein
MSASEQPPHHIGAHSSQANHRKLHDILLHQGCVAARRRFMADNHGRAKSGSKPEKKHLAAPVAPQGLHGSVIDDFHRTTECLREIEADPSAPKIMRLSDHSAVEHRAQITDRHRVVGPIRREFLHACDHVFGGHLRPGGKRAMHFAPAAKT